MTNSTDYLVLEGINLTATGVTVRRLSQSSGQRVRQALEEIHGGGQIHERLGVDLQTVQIEFIFIGRGQAKWDTRELVRGILTGRDNWTLEAPVDQFIINNFQSGVFATSGDVTLDEDKALSKIMLRVSAIYEGSPRSEGGSFESCAGYSVEFVDNDFWAATDSSGFTDAPLIGFPLQAAGYPQANAATTPFAKTIIASSAKKYLIAAGDGEEGIVEIVSIAGYVNGAPHAAGNGGPAYVCESAAVEDGSDFSYLNVETVPNDFGIDATYPWLYGRLLGGVTPQAVFGPIDGIGLSLLLTAAGDGTTAQILIRQTYGRDSIYIYQEA